MSLNGKLDGFTLGDFIALGEAGNLRKRNVLPVYERVKDAVARWPAFAEQAGIPEDKAFAIASTHRMIER